MDLPLYARVLWRHRPIVGAGLALAVVLAALAYGSPSLVNGRPTLVPRGSERWQSAPVLLITQAGFPYGRAVPQYTSPDPKSGLPPVQLGDQGRFAGLATIYSQLANSDAVQLRLRPDLPPHATVTATPSVDESGAPLPLISLAATAGSAAEVTHLAQRATTVFRRFVAAQQTQAQIPQGERVELQVLDSGKTPKLIQARGKTLPVLVFLALVIATIALTFMLENASRRASGPEVVPLTVAPQRASR